VPCVISLSIVHWMIIFDPCLMHLTYCNFYVNLKLGVNQHRERGLNMGLGLQRMNRARRGKLPIVITEGRIRPVAPIVAAKFATECNIAVRNHVLVLKSWKEYEKHPGLFKLFTAKLSVSTITKPFFLL
jgi:hypothetical protein